MLYYEKMKAQQSEAGGSVWHEGDFPFLYVQLAAPFRAMALADPKAARPHLGSTNGRGLSFPNTGMAVTNDIGNVKDIHPKDKQDVGKRLALWALAKNYGKQIVCSRPAHRQLDERSTARRSASSLTHVEVGGLIARNGKPLDWFQIAGDDKKFVDAEATIDGDSGDRQLA